MLWIATSVVGLLPFFMVYTDQAKQPAEKASPSTTNRQVVRHTQLQVNLSTKSHTAKNETPHMYLQKADKDYITLNEKKKVAAGMVGKAEKGRNGEVHVTKSQSSGCINKNKGVIANMTNTVFIAVFSRPDNVADRKRLRELFSVKNKDVLLEYAFFLGSSANASVRRQLQMERKTHGDIVTGQFTDTYRNLYRKSLFMLKWIKELCHAPKLVLKLDEDLRINMTLLHRTLLNITIPRDKGIIVGDVQYNGKPQRKVYQTYRLTKNDYQDDTFPPFTYGPAYIISGNAVPKLYNASFSVPHLWLEDVYITGILRQHAGVEIRSALEHGRFVCSFKRLGRNGCAFGHEGRLHEIMEKLRAEETALKMNNTHQWKA